MSISDLGGYYICEVFWKREGWEVRVLDRNKGAYEGIETTVKGYSVVSLNYLFFKCNLLTIAPPIPEKVE